MEYTNKAWHDSINIFILNFLNFISKNIAGSIVNLHNSS